METIDLLLSRASVQSVTVSRTKVVIIANNMSHTYSRQYFDDTIVPKLLKCQAAA